mmetsp:Transcript_5241/g.14643  ORF Transcript_5241/g.14643 Transcript_5241/m.14643 type:complete len:346 (-) Transcript_5241:252-1289(-)
MGAKGSKPEPVEFDTSKNRQWILKRRPKKEPRHGDLVMEVAERPTCGEGQVLIRTTLLSIDPTQRIWMSDMPQYMEPVGIGEVMRAGGAGEVVESRFPGLAVGDKVFALTGMQDFCVIPGEVATKIDDAVKPEDALSIYSVVIGLTAYHGVMKICKPKEGETVVISGAAGAVGSVSGQLAKIAGARVIGVVGSASKAKWITEELGFDGAINYKTDNLDEKLKELAPGGVDCYFENTGGPVTEAVFLQFNNFARVAFCGSIGAYNKHSPPGPKNYFMTLMRRVRIQGFICTDHLDEMPEMLEAMKKYVAAGKIKYNVDVREGLSSYLEVVNLLFSGGNTGKLCLKP